MQNLHSLNRFSCSISTDWNQPKQWLHSYQACKNKAMSFTYREMLRKWSHKINNSQFFDYLFIISSGITFGKSFVNILWQSDKMHFSETPSALGYLYSCCLAAFSEGQRLPHLSPALSGLLLPFVSSNNPAVIKNSISVTSLTRELCLVFCHTGSRDNQLALLVSLEEFMFF